jgi:hypothetical protein
MKFILTLIIFLFVFNSVISQNDSLKHAHTYVPLKMYKKKYGQTLTKKDSLNFLIRENDTLILDANYIRPPGKSVPYEYKDDSFLELYKKITFRLSSDSTKKSEPMRYWKNDLKIFISNSINKKIKKDFFNFSREISNQVDSLNIKEVKSVEESNYIIYQSGDFEYESRIGKNTSTDYYMYWNGNSQIYKTTLRIIKEDFFNSSLLLNIMKDYFLKSLGHFDLNYSLGCENYFSGCQEGNIRLTQLDLKILKYHYSYGICKGTDIETFESQHKTAKETLKQHNHRMSFYHQY